MYGQAVSVSRVREYIGEDKVEETKVMVPYTTYDYFKSKEAKELIKIIKEDINRR